MNASVNLASLETQAFSLMGRLHVMLRRQTGRVTDIEYMRIDPAYCRHLLEMASKMPDGDLQEICAKLEEVYFGEEGLFVREPPRVPLLTRIANAAAAKPAAAPVAAAPKPVMPAPPTLAPQQATETPVAPAASTLPQDHGGLVDQGYVGRLR
jgi:hypothetical protein